MGDEGRGKERKWSRAKRESERKPGRPAAVIPNLVPVHSPWVIGIRTRWHHLSHSHSYRPLCVEHRTQTTRALDRLNRCHAPPRFPERTVVL